MADGLALIGFKHSVYTRIVRMALIEMGLQADYVEADPFAESPDPILSAHTLFGRVPVLRHADFTLTETAAIVRYLDALSTTDTHVPADPTAAAQMAQVIGIVDAYGYWPLVRDVFSHGYYRPRFNLEADRNRITSGLSDAVPVLRTLDAIAGQGRVLSGAAVTLADLHLAPMLDYFTRVAQGREMLAQYPALQRWWERLPCHSALSATDPLPAH